MASADRYINRVSLNLTVGHDTKKILQECAEKTGVPISRIIDELVCEKLECDDKQTAVDYGVVLEEKELELLKLKEEHNKQIIELHDEYRKQIFELQNRIV